MPTRSSALAAAVEAASEHPCPDAILAAADQRALPGRPPGDQLQATLGIGVMATVQGQRLFVGRHDAGGNGRIILGSQAAQPLAALEAAAETTVILADGDQPLGLLAVAELHEFGLRVAMLSGDHERVAA
jgi:cation transport ATPase